MKWSWVDDSILAKEINAGRSYEDVAKFLGRTPEAIAHRRRALGIEYRHRPRPREAYMSPRKKGETPIPCQDLDPTKYDYAKADRKFQERWARVYGWRDFEDVEVEVA